MQPGISILIRTKNEIASLPTTLRLIGEQSIEPEEVIVIDSAFGLDAHASS